MISDIYQEHILAKPKQAAQNNELRRDVYVYISKATREPK